MARVMQIFPNGMAGFDIVSDPFCSSFVGKPQNLAL
jgi:hypothetical protein